LEKVLSNVAPLESNISARRNFFRAVLDEKAVTVPQITAFMLLENDAHKTTFLEWFKVSARLMTGSEILKVVASALSFDMDHPDPAAANNFPLVFRGTSNLSLPTKAAYAAFTTKVETENDLRRFDLFKTAIGTAKKAVPKSRGKPKTTTATSALTRESKKILASFRRTVPAGSSVHRSRNG